MDEVAEAIGQLRAGLDAIARNQQAMSLERAAQHTEALTRLTDVQAQIHEIKHAQNNDAVKFARIEQQVIAHQDADKRDHDHVISTLASHQLFAEVGIGRLEREILANREAAEAREAGLKARLDDLVAWRRSVYAVGAVFLLGLTVFGHEIWEAAKHLGHWFSK